MHLDTQDDQCINQGHDESACLEVGCCVWDSDNDPARCWKEGSGDAEQCDTEYDDYRKNDCPTVKYGLRLKTLAPTDSSATVVIDTTTIQGGFESSPTTFNRDNWPEHMPVAYDGTYLTFLPRF